jgi:hypothetical protein
VVFASSNWAVKGTEHELAPACYLPDGPKIGSDAPPRPITAYGVAKAFGEISGRMAVDRSQLETFVAVRIGSFLPFPPEDERRTRWIGVQDIRSLLRRCVRAELNEFHVFYGFLLNRPRLTIFPTPESCCAGSREWQTALLIWKRLWNLKGW